MAKQVFVDFELPEAMLADVNKIIMEKFPAWIAKHRDNRVASIRILWAGWLFLKYEEGIAGQYHGNFPGIEYQPYNVMDRPLVFQTVMLESQYQDAMERMDRLYPGVYQDKTKDNNYFLACLGYAALRELYDGKIELHYDKEAVKDIESDGISQLQYAWLADSKEVPFNITKKEQA